MTSAPTPLMADARRQPGLAQAQPVPHHAGLRERERDEDADRVERHQGVGVAAEDHDQGRGEAGQHQDAVGEHQPVAENGELARQEAVAREQRGQPREVGERGVGGQDQDERRSTPGPGSRAAPAPKTRWAICDTTVSLSTGRIPRAEARKVIPTNIVPRMSAMKPSVIAALRDSGARKAGTPLEMASMPVSAVQPDGEARASTGTRSAPPSPRSADGAAGGRCPSQPIGADRDRAGRSSR